MYWLALVSSIASIVSLLISFIDVFKKWKAYLLPIGCVMGGLTGGILLSMSEKTMQQFTQAQLIYLVALVSIIALIIVFAHGYFKTANEPILGVILVFVGLGYFSIRLLNSVDASMSTVKPNDYLVLSEYYIQHEQYIHAADYLKKYRDLKTSELPDKILDSIDNKISSCQMKALNISH